MPKRVKVKVEHKRKLFYQKYLEACREASDDRNQQCTLYKAISGLRTFPLEVDGINDLKQINGIGDTIATRCAAAWEQICTDRQKELDLDEIKQLTKDDYLLLSIGTKNAKRKQQSPKKKAAERGANEFDEPAKKRGKGKNVVGTGSKGRPSLGGNCEFLEDSDIEENRHMPSTATDSHALLGRTESAGSDADFSCLEERYLTCRPHEDAQVILICDTRENRQKKHGYNVVEVLATSNNVRHETRVLSVGDFLWIARKIDGSEMVLDWVVERKTWEDLDSSIRKGRYDEQKQRLSKAPMNNRVYLLEDRGRGPVGAEQALATTRSRDGFLIQRCRDGKETAKFLEAVTRRLAVRIKKQTITGVSFNHLQGIAEKGQVSTVRNVWVEQLTVCPGMSSSRALSVVEAFPSLASLSDHYSSSVRRGVHPTEVLTKAIPQLPKPISTKIAGFFVE